MLIGHDTQLFAPAKRPTAEIAAQAEACITAKMEPTAGSVESGARRKAEQGVRVEAIQPYASAA